MTETDLNDIISGSGGNSLMDSPLSGIGALIAPILIVSVILTLIIVGVYIYSLVSRFRAERATVAMQKDISDIKSLLEKSLKSAPAPVAAGGDLAEVEDKKNAVDDLVEHENLEQTSENRISQ